MTFTPELTLDGWRAEKAELLRRAKLDCGCPNDGRDVYFHMACPRLACSRHADTWHICRRRPGGAVQAPDPVPPPPEPVVTPASAAEDQPVWYPRPRWPWRRRG